MTLKTWDERLELSLQSHVDVTLTKTLQCKFSNQYSFLFPLHTHTESRCMVRTVTRHWVLTWCGGGVSLKKSVGKGRSIGGFQFLCARSDIPSSFWANTPRLPEVIYTPISKQKMFSLLTVYIRKEIVRKNNCLDTDESSISWKKGTK